MLLEDNDTANECFHTMLLVAVVQSEFMCTKGKSINCNCAVNLKMKFSFNANANFGQLILLLLFTGSQCEKQMKWCSCQVILPSIQPSIHPSIIYHLTFIPAALGGDTLDFNN